MKNKNFDELDIIEKARNHVYELCKDINKWTMHVPVDEENDSDCIIISALDYAESLEKENKRLKQMQIKLKPIDLSTYKPTFIE